MSTDNEEKKREFGRRLYQVMIARKIDKETICQRTGIPERRLSRWIRDGVIYPKGRTKADLDKVCDVLNISPESLWEADDVTIPRHEFDKLLNALETANKILQRLAVKKKA